MPVSFGRGLSVDVWPVVELSDTEPCLSVWIRLHIWSPETPANKQVGPSFEPSVPQGVCMWCGTMHRPTGIANLVLEDALV